MGNRESKETVRKRGKRTRDKLRKKARDYLGGECQTCGYNKCLDALDFHHRDKKEKSFSINFAFSHHYSWDKIKAELDKCDLLCSNCHREFHSKEK